MELLELKLIASVAYIVQLAIDFLLVVLPHDVGKCPQAKQNYIINFFHIKLVVMLVVGVVLGLFKLFESCLSKQKRLFDVILILSVVFGIGNGIGCIFLYFCKSGNKHMWIIFANIMLSIFLLITYVSSKITRGDIEQGIPRLLPIQGIPNLVQD